MSSKWKRGIEEYFKIKRGIKNDKLKQKNWQKIDCAK